MSPAALGFPGSEVMGRTPRSDTTGTLWPSEFRVKYVSGIFCLCIFFHPSFRRGKQKAGKEGRRSGGILSERWCKGQVSLADRLKYHSLPGARHPLWCSEGVCDKSGVMWRGGGGGGRLPSRSRQGTRSIKCLWLNHWLWVNPPFSFNVALHLWGEKWWRAGAHSELMRF